MKDLKKMYTPREATALYNLNRIKFNPGAYSLKGNLILNRNALELDKEHISNIQYGAETTLFNALRHERFRSDAAAGIDLKFDYPETLVLYRSTADTACVMQTNLSIALEVLQSAGISMDAFKGSSIESAILQMLIALSSSESCTNELYWTLTEYSNDYNYLQLHNFEPLKDALKDAHCEKIPVNLNLTASDVCFGHSPTPAKNPIVQIKAYVYILEVLWAWTRLTDDEFRKNIAWWLATAGSKGSEDVLMEHWGIKLTYDNIEIPEELLKMISIKNPGKRYAAYNEYISKNLADWVSKAKVASEPIAFETPLGIFLAFAESCSVTHVRVNTVRLLYAYCNEKGLLDDDDYDEIGETGLEAVFKITSSATSEEEESADLMDLGKKVYGKEEPSDERRAAEDKPLFEALDAVKSSFETAKYKYTSKDVRVTDPEAKDRYAAICSKVSLINKNLIKRIKAIKTYNTGGKNPGAAVGKLDRKTMYRYKYDPNIFYNNTYKTLESDLAFGIILDISGSMHGKGIENGRITMIVLHETLKALGINHSIIGHTCYGSDYSCDIERYQSFREDKTYTVCKNYALADLKARSGNCDSGALYYMEKALSRVHNKDKICLMFSDGEPTECTGTDLINQVKAMERKGIKVIGIGINYPNIAKYYSDYANGRNLKDMLDIVSNILQEYVLKKKVN